MVWISGAGKVVDVHLARRWRLAYVPCRPARYVLEMAAAGSGDNQIGDKLRFEEVPAG